VRKYLARWLLIGTFAGIGFGALVGLGLSRFLELPAVEALTTYRPASATEIRARDGSLLATFASQRRIPLAPDQIPKLFRQAVIAAEDADFYHHPGLDPKGMLRAAVMNLFHRRYSQGASTITQQLARTLFLTPEKKIVRKIKEALLAVEIEQRFSKDQILAMYANQMYFGHGRYGVEAASRFFFGKPAAELDLPEAALLAGILQRNDYQSPIRHPDRALARRNYTLRRMLEEGFITKEQCEQALKTPIDAAAHYDRNATADYFIEEVRRSVEEKYGSHEMLEGGLRVATTLDPHLQRMAEVSLRDGLVALQRRLGWPGARRNLIESGVSDLERWRDPNWNFLEWRDGELVSAVVNKVEAHKAELFIAGRDAVLKVADAEWTGRDNLTRLMKRGDVLLVRLKGRPPEGEQPISVQLEPEPTVEGALVAVDNRTGAVLALVGGFDFDRSQFDRVMQAKRQCGSSFKPFVYLAAFERGMSPTDTIFDGPILLPDEYGDLTYCPLNYYRTFFGIVTLRYALEHSLNTCAVKVQQMVSGEAVIDVARRLGITEPLRPYPSLALGSFEVSPWEMVGAYAGIANGGQRVEPYFLGQVTDGSGKVLERHRPQPFQALREDIAFLMTHTLEGVVQRGTGVAAAKLPGHLAGKTGTTDSYTDAWFIGYSPRITCAVWVGRDMKERIGRNMTGAEAALPTWMDFMAHYLASLPEGVRREEFPVPAGVVMVPVDPRTGLRAVPACGDNVILDAVLEGHEPTSCSTDWHQIVALPWMQQLPYYTYKPGEPPTTPQAVAEAMAKIDAESTPGEQPATH
jgi:penicillin-binding protein 1A